jgi:hypothetical protein
MKKQLLILFVCVIFANISYAQLTHVEGIKTFDVKLCITNDASGVTLGYSKFITDKIYLRGGILADWGKQSEWNKKFSSIGVNFSGALNIMEFNEFFYLNVYGGLSFSSESLKDAEIYDVKNGMQVGPLIGIEAEAYISPSVAIVLNGDARYLLLKNFGGLRSYVMGGVKFAF